MKAFLATMLFGAQIICLVSASQHGDERIVVNKPKDAGMEFKSFTQEET